MSHHRATGAPAAPMPPYRLALALGALLR